MANLLYYWLIEPNRGYIDDDGVRTAAIELNLSVNGIQYVFGVYCDDQGNPWFAKVSIPNVDKEEIPESALPIITMLPEHLRSVLTMTWRPDVRYLPIELVHLQRKQGDRGIKCQLQQAPEKQFNATSAQSLFAFSIKFREEFEFFTEGLNDQLPLKYRYLSLYKLFEKHFEKTADQERVLEPFRDFKASLGLTQNLQTELKEVRNRCAHSVLDRPKSKGVRKGVTSLSRSDGKKVSSLLPILLKISSDVINQMADGKFSINGEPNWHRYAALVHPNTLKNNPKHY
jgi:hypothetical protein